MKSFVWALIALIFSLSHSNAESGLAHSNAESGLVQGLAETTEELRLLQSEVEALKSELLQLENRFEMEVSELISLINDSRTAVFSGESGTQCNGLRNTSRRVTVRFPESFSQPPKVMIAFSRYGTGTRDGNTRGRIDLAKVGKESFQVVCASWDGTRGDYAFSWIAVGPR